MTLPPTSTLCRFMFIYHSKHENASKTCTLRQKVRQKHVPLGKKSVRATDFQGGSKTRTLRQKVRQKHVPLGRKSGSKRQKHVPLDKKCVKNTYPRAKSRPWTHRKSARRMGVQNPSRSQLLAFSLLLVELSARRHKLRCLFLSVLIFVRASAPCLANFDPRPTGGRADGRAPAAPDGRAGGRAPAAPAQRSACGAP